MDDVSDMDAIGTLAETTVRELTAAGKSVSVAEACTGGWIAKALTDVSGSSACFGYGIVTYSNGAKESMLGVSPASLDTHGAVSEAVVREMAAGALNLSGADYAVAVSGVAGPGGGSAEKPVGTVWLAWAARMGQKSTVDARKHLLEGDREAVRSTTVILALQGILERIGLHG
jgi:nicotinamide-nucleotide amidase